MNRRRFFSFLAPLGLVFLWPRDSKATKVQKYGYLAPEEYNQKIVQEHLNNISRRIQDLEGGR